MTLRRACIAAALPLVTAASQQQPTAAQLAYQTDYAAHHAEFDYLLGNWELDWIVALPTGGTVTLKGFWGAVRSPDGALVTDEFRIVNDSGRTTYVSTTLRAYSPIERRWNIVGIEPGAGLVQLGTAWKEGNDMRIDQTFKGERGQSMLRVRYYDIAADRFSWRADRSMDGGKTWEKDYRRAEARRIGPAREPNSLTPRKDLPSR